MTWLRRLLLGAEPKPERLLPSDHRVRCPECQSDQPAFEMLLLRDVALRDGEGIVSVVSGKRLACQQCPCVYSVGPHGVFRHHRASQPYPSGPPEPKAAAQQANEPPHIPERAPLLRVPLERPRV